METGKHFELSVTFGFSVKQICIPSDLQFVNYMLDYDLRIPEWIEYFTHFAPNTKIYQSLNMQLPIKI